MITYCVNTLRSYSEVTPPQKSVGGAGALEVQQYQNMRGTTKRAGIAADQ